MIPRRLERRHCGGTVSADGAKTHSSVILLWLWLPPSARILEYSRQWIDCELCICSSQRVETSDTVICYLFIYWYKIQQTFFICYIPIVDVIRSQPPWIFRGKLSTFILCHGKRSRRVVPNRGVRENSVAGCGVYFNLWTEKEKRKKLWTFFLLRSFFLSLSLILFSLSTSSSCSSLLNGVNDFQRRRYADARRRVAHQEKYSWQSFIMYIFTLYKRVPFVCHWCCSPCCRYCCCCSYLHIFLAEF